MSFVKLWIIAAFVVLVLVAPPFGLAASSAEAPKKDAPATTTTTASADEPTGGESFVAVLAILGGVAVIFAVILLVGRAHDIEERLATATVARGGSVSSITTPAAAGDETVAAATTIPITGPNELAAGAAGEFTIERTVANPTWSVTGIGAFTQLLKEDGHTFVFTPYEPKDDVKIKVTDGTSNGEKPVRIVAAAKASFVARFAVRNWGLVVVAVAIVFGAIALGVTGHLDGGNFVALVAPLAALLGVTAAVSERGGSGGGSSGGSAGGGASGGGSGGGSTGS